MAGPLDLTNDKVSFTYDRLVQTDGAGNYFNGLGDPLTIGSGSQGPQGDQGAQGDQGDQGTQGAQGDQGDQGTQGAQGAQGDQGTQGFQGPQGSPESEVQNATVTPYTITTTANQYVYVVGVDTSSSAAVVNLPSASFGGIIIHIKDVGVNSYTNNITINVNGSDTIITTTLGNTSVTLSADGGAIILASNGVDQWWFM